MGKRELIKSLSGIRVIRVIRGLFKVSAGTALGPSSIFEIKFAAKSFSVD